MFLFFVKSPVYGVSITDEFNTQDSTLWNYIVKSGKVEYHDGYLEMSSLANNFPEIYSKWKIFENKGDQLEYIFKYNGGDEYEYPPSGTGIGVGNTDSSGTYTYYQFAIWRDRASGPHLIINDFGLSSKGDCELSGPFSDLSYRTIVGITLNRTDWNKMIIKRNFDDSYSIFVNDILVHTTLADQCKPSLITLGNPLSAWSWNGISVDKISSISEIAPEKPIKTIIIPGLGASWNERAMVFNQTVESSEWRMTPFVNNYKKLIEYYGENGIVWNYDWRKPVDQIVGDFDEFVKSTFAEEDNFEIVGHSLGGLVGRIWAQKNQEDLRLKKVTTLGSPHKGSIDAFRVWSGGNISEDVDVSSIALNVLLQLQKKNGENKIDTIRRYAPVLKDLSPTFDFVKKNNQIIGVGSMQTKNDYLIAANETNDSRVYTYSGIGFDTERYVNVGKRNIFESLLGWWPDGKILGYENGDGDRTVLKDSSNYGNNSEFNFEHGALPDAFVGNLIGNYDLKNNWVFYVGSPAIMKIDCNGENVGESNDFIVIKKEQVDGCKIKFEGKEDGLVHFVYGISGNEYSWGYKEFEIVNGEVVHVGIDSKSDKLTFEITTEKKSILAMLLELKVKYPKHREIDRAIISAKKENWRSCLVEIFALRKGIIKINDTDLLIEELTFLGEKKKVMKSVASHWWGVEGGISRMIELVARPNNKTAKSYAYWVDSDNKMEQCWKEKDYACVESRGLTNSFLFSEIIYWR